MNKNTQNNLDYRTRSANHSTKGSRRGFCDIGVIVDESELKDSAAAVRERLVIVKSRLIEERRDIENILMPLRAKRANWKNNVTHKYKGREHLFSDHPEKAKSLKRYFEAGDLLSDIDEKIKGIPKPRKGGDLPNLFMDEARNALDPEIFQEIKQRVIRRMSEEAKQ